MTKQEEIRDGIVNWFLERNPNQTRSWAEWETKMLFIKQDSQGVVIRSNSLGASHPHLVNYFTIEPLIKED